MNLIGGPLWQWDTERYVEVPDTAIYCYFALKDDEETYAVEVEDKTAAIPNILLQSCDGIQAWATDGTKTVDAAIFAVRKRAQPSDYVYTETEVTTVETIAAAAVAEALADLDLSSLIDLDYATVEYVDEQIAALDFATTEYVDAQIATANSYTDAALVTAEEYADTVVEGVETLSTAEVQALIDAAGHLTATDLEAYGYQTASDVQTLIDAALEEIENGSY